MGARGTLEHARHVRRSEHVTLQDFELFFDSPELALRAFSVFDADNDSRVTRKEVRGWRRVQRVVGSVHRCGAEVRHQGLPATTLAAATHCMLARCMTACLLPRAAQVKEAVLAIYNERANMAASLQDTDSIVQARGGTGCSQHACCHVRACHMPELQRSRSVRAGAGHTRTQGACASGPPVPLPRRALNML